jgi:hypothetical protein
MKLDVATRAARPAVLALTLLSIGSAVEAGGQPPQPPVFVYDCDNLATITGRQFADRVEISSRGFGRLVLSQTATDPATFADRTVTVMMNADYLRVTGSMGNTVCRRALTEAPWQEARSRGIEFRATGAQPDWILEYDEGTSLTLVAGGDFAPLIARPMGVVASSGNRMAIEGSDGTRAVLVAIERGICSGPSGVTTQRVTVTVEDHAFSTSRTFSGCGRALLSGKLNGIFSWEGRLPADAVLAVRIIRVGAAKGDAPLAEWRGPVTSSADSPFLLEYDVLRVFGDDRFVLETSIHAGARSCHSRGPLFVLTWGTFGNVRLSPEKFTALRAAPASRRRTPPPRCGV